MAKMYSDLEVKQLLMRFASRLGQIKGQHIPTIQLCEEFIEEHLYPKEKVSFLPIGSVIRLNNITGLWTISEINDLHVVLKKDSTLLPCNKELYVTVVKRRLS